MCTTAVVRSSSLVSLLYDAHSEQFDRTWCCEEGTEELMCLRVGVIITDGEYPVRPAFSLLTKLLDDFIAKVPVASYSSPAAISFPEISSYISKYQDPRQADAIMKVQQELDETKIILVSVDDLRLRRDGTVWPGLWAHECNVHIEVSCSWE